MKQLRIISTANITLKRAVPTHTVTPKQVQVALTHTVFNY